MSKLHVEYLKRKKENDQLYYLFKSGMFYIFIDEDAEEISKFVPLKLTKFNNDIYKCGFPKNSLDKYLEVFKNLKLDVLVVEECQSDKTSDRYKEKIIKKIKDLDLENTTPIKAFNLLCEFKGLLDE